MTPSELQTPWQFPLLNVSEDKRASRVAVPAGMASEMVGVDGNSESGIRPLPGMKLVRELQPKVLTEGIVPKDSFTGRSEILDVFQVNFRVGTDGYGYGFIYRITKDPNYLAEVGGDVSNAADVFFDFWSSHPAPGAVSGWSDGNTFDNRVVVDCSSEAPMDVVVSPNGLIYILIQGRGPALCYQDKNSPYALLRLGDDGAPFPGPGLRPQLLPPERGVALGDVTSIDNGNRPATGQIWLGTIPPSMAGMALTQPDADTRLMVEGAYSFAYQLYNSESGRRSALSEIAWANEDDFTGGPSYFALELFYDSNKFDQAYIYRSVRVQDAGGTYVASYLHLERIITLADYASDLATAYPFEHSVYYYELEDKALVFQDYFLDRATFDEIMPKGGRAIMYGSTMLMSRISGGTNSSTEESRPDDAVRGLGELRYSSLTDISPELFPPSNRYVPAVPSNEILAFAQVGDAIVGWSLDRQYYSRKSGSFLATAEAHEGFGIVGPKAVDVVGSMAYFVTTKGVKAVDANQQLDSVASFNKVIMEDWDKEDLPNLMVSYDQSLSALFIHNAAEKHTLAMWFNTGKAAEIFDMPFSHAVSGVWPTDLNDPASQLVGRTFFVQDCPDHSTSDEFLPNWRPRVFVIDSGRSKNFLTMMDIEYSEASPTLLFTVDTASAGGVTVDETPEGSFEGAFLYVLDSSDPDYIGLKGQISWVTGGDTFQLNTTDLDDLPEGSIVGLSPVYVRWIGHPLDVRVETDQGIISQGSGFHRIKQMEGLSCAFTDVAGGQAGETTAKYRGLCFRGSDETPLSAIPPVGARDGDSVGSVIEREARNAAYFREANSTSVAAHGVSGNCLCPGVEIFCPDLDYRLVSVEVRGKILGTGRSRNSA